jgi:hypothetical protein
MGPNIDATQTKKDVSFLTDYLRTAPVGAIAGEADKLFSPLKLVGSSYAGELTVKLPNTNQLKLSHTVIATIAGIPGIAEGQAEEKSPTAVVVGPRGEVTFTFSGADSHKIHRALGSRILDLREWTEHRLALINADVLLDPTSAPWRRHDSSKDKETFVANTGEATLWLSRKESTFLGFRRERYELAACFSCKLFHAESRYSDDRARILFQAVSRNVTEKTNYPGHTPNGFV